VDRKMDLRPVLDHWRNAVLQELNFEVERRNMEDVGSNLRDNPGAYASVPRAIAALSSKRVMVMRLVRGAKVTDELGLRAVGITGYHAKGLLAQDIVDATAHAIFVDGTFNSDPHQGNLLVCRREDLAEGQTMALPESIGHADPQDAQRPIPVLLDFGLTCRLPDRIRLGLARLVLAGSQLDMGSILLAGKELGIVLNREDLVEDLSGFLHMFRDIASPEEARKQVQARIKLEKQKVAERGFRNPVESFPPELLLFFRALNLTRGVLSTLDVKVPFIKLLAGWARKALVEKLQPQAEERIRRLAEHQLLNAHEAYAEHLPAPPAPQDAHSPSSTKTATAAAAAVSRSRLMSPLETALREALRECEADGSLVGAQVVVIDEAKALDLDICYGTLGIADPRPVESATLFSAVSLAQTVAQVGMLLKLEGGTSYAAKVKLPVEEVLSGQLGALPLDPTAVPSNFSTKQALNWRDSIAFVEGALAAVAGGAREEQKLTAPQPRAASKLPFELSHAAFSWGFLALAAAEQVEQAQAGEQQPALARAVAQLSGNQVRLGLGSEEEAQALLDSGSVAQLSFPVQKLLEQHGIADIGAMGDLETHTGGPGSASQAPGLEMLTELVPGLKSKEFWVDPRMVNCPAVLAACNPASSVLCTAKALARIVHGVGHSGRCMGEQVLPGPVANSAADIARAGTTQDPFEEGRVGLRSFLYTNKSGDRNVAAIGQLAFGGSAVLTFPELSLTVCVLINSLSLDRKATQTVLDKVYSAYGLCPRGDF
jgi:predicted unusual protein kinase regulating ubiquinone biosynthesis (AarF/ABC1/UbiB family)